MAVDPCDTDAGEEGVDLGGEPRIVHLDPRGMDALMYLGEDPRTERVIIETLARLPEIVRTFAIERCVFVSIGWAASGITLPGAVGVDPITRRSRNVWLILVEERASREVVAAVVAHEVAHAWLRHDRLSDKLPEDHEVRAAELAHSWGFTGRPADPEFWARKLEREREASAGPHNPAPYLVLDSEPSATIRS